MSSCALQLLDPQHHSLEELKHSLRSHLVNVDQVRSFPGLSTGHDSLDKHLHWKGLPKGAVSFFYGPRGQGATSLWLQTALRATQHQLWAAWVNAPGIDLCPWGLQQAKADLSRLVITSAPDSLPLARFSTFKTQKTGPSIPNSPSFGEQPGLRKQKPLLLPYS